jgi:hypothetical protein
VLVFVANAESTIADLAASGAHVPDHLVWSWEWSSLIGWVTTFPAIWWAVGRVRPPRVGWGVVATALAGGSVLASAWHIGVMVAIRHGYYAATGEGPYRFFGVLPNRIAYEYRKDLASFLQFVAVAAVVRWAISRAADPAPSPGEAPRTLAVSEGAVTHHVPVAEIASVSAAGNYVEIAWAGRTLLHRATLAATAAELGDGFVRIHRSRLVRREAVRRVAVDRSGDYDVTLDTGETLRGSRRYRPPARAT